MTRDIDYQSWETELFIVQGGSRRELIAEGKELLAFLDGTAKFDFADLAYSLNCPLKEDAPFALSIVAADGGELKKKLSFSLDKIADESTGTIKDRSGIFFFEEQIAREGKLAFVFPGEGSQYPGMLGDLCRHFPLVREYFDLSDRVFRETGRSPLPSEVAFPPPKPGGEVEGLQLTIQ